MTDKPKASKPAPKKAAKPSAAAPKKKRRTIKPPDESKRPVGRPSIYSQELADRFCAEISSGKSMRTVCKADDMPDATTIFRWLRESPEFNQRYARACEERAESLVEDALEIADASQDDFVPDGDGGMRFNSEAVQRSRLRVDTRKWFAAKLHPKKFSEKVDLNHGGQPANPIQLLIQQAQGTSIAPVRDDPEHMPEADADD